MTAPPTLEDGRCLCDAAGLLVERALERAREITEGGRRIDEHQVLAERVSYAATEARAARDTVDAAAAARAEGGSGEMLERTATAAVAGLTASLRSRLEPALDDLGLGEAVLEETFPAQMRALLRSAGHASVLQSIGRHVAETRGRNNWQLDDLAEQVRAAVRDFADKEVAPEAERIHRNDELVPERFISHMAELGYFGLAIPEAYGGSDMGNLAMILTTEELSRASLAAAGSLITRPEILTKALLQGGTEEQKQHWLPLMASGEIMVGIASWWASR
jgi:(2S)-methylsuccinyl-CoA dehydrogenase